ncbi:phosphotriesterase-related protein [Sporichthya brevicatena]|uniref:phosphotriesterase family protein n=1 Tax=Sporichthya brevicatena TaxID=171442 RepID=UPI0031E433B1
MLVPTVTGPVPLSELGRVLMHEHVFVHTAEIARDYPDLTWTDRDAVREAAVERLTELSGLGIDTMLDLTVLGCDRSIPDIAWVAERVAVRIVVATGLYTLDDLPRFVAARPPEPGQRDVLTEMFVRDITVGIGDTGVRAGVLKCCIDKPGLTPGVERVLRATAHAHRETGVLISTHTDASSRSGLVQQQVFTEEGVDLARVVIGHSGDSTDLDYLMRLMDAGSTIGCDRFGLYRAGMPTLGERLDAIASLCARGYADRIVLSHDAHCHSDWVPPDIREVLPDWNYAHIPAAVLPGLQERGVTDTQIDQMLRLTPRRLLPASDAY